MWLEGQVMKTGDLSIPSSALRLELCDLKLHAICASVSSLMLLFSCSVVSNSLRPHGLSTPGFPVLHHLPEFAQTFYFLFNIYLFWLCWVSVVPLRSSLRHVGNWPGMGPRSPALEAQGFSHWNTREVPVCSSSSSFSVFFHNSNHSVIYSTVYLLTIFLV